MKRKSLLFMLLLALLAPWAAMGQETLTVNEGTATTYYAPMYVFYWDDYTRAQTVFPASQLEDMDGGTITAITFYTNSNNIPYTSAATYDAYLAEVSSETISDYIDRSAATTVISGATAEFVSDGNGGGMITITLSTPYVYGGGNLLFGCDNNTDAGYKSIYFYGVSGVSGASISGSNSSASGTIPATQRNFLPMTTFTYTPGTSTGCAKPRQLAVNYTGGLTATATWTGEASGYDVELNGQVIATNVTGTSYPISGLQLATTYTVRVRGNCGGDDVSDWTNAQTFTTDLCMPENMCEITYELADSYGDGWNGNTLSVVDVATTAVLATWTIPSGGSSASGSLALCDGREIQFVWAGTSWPYENSFTVYDINGEIICQHIKDDVGPAVGILSNYTVSCTMSSCRKPTNLAASEIGSRTAKLSWTENGEARSWNLLVNGEPIEGVDNPHTLTGLTPETAYTVQVSPVCEVEKWSDAITFTTLELCPKPTNVAVSDITPMSANVSWTGTASSYNLRYRTARGFHYDFETATPWVEDNFAPCTTYDGDGLTTYQITDWTPLGTYQFVGSMMTLQSGVTDFASAHGGELFGGFVSGIPTEDVTHNDDYFILPSITIEDGYVFEFWASSLLNNWGLEHMRVGVYGGNGTITEYLAGSATDYVEVPNGWTKYSYDLSGFAGQTIQLAINSLCPDAYILGIDDIFVGDPNEDTWDVTLNDVTSPYALTGLTEETMYEVQVQAACGEDGESAWVSATFTTLSNCEAPTALNVTNLMPTTATLNWTGYQDGFEARYRTPAGQEVFFFEDFEGTTDNELPEGWTTIDNDGDGYVWYTINQESFAQYSHSGQGIATSASYTSSDLTPDNWLITPQIALQGTMKVYLRAQDPSWADEHYAIYLSTTGNTVDDFTVTLVEESADLSGEYIEVTADLSSYNGTMGYIAIRHFNCEGQFRINVDDFGLYGGETPASDWTYVTSGDLFADIEDLDPETTYEWQVRGENRSCTNGEEAGYTPWSEMSTFTTPGLCDDPNTFLFENLAATTATLTWTGYQESYNVMYRTAEIGYEFWDDFSDGFVNWTGDNLSEDNYVDQVTASGIMGYIMFWDDELGAQTMISNELEPTPSGASLTFYAATGGVSTYKVGYSSTDNALASFTWSGEIICEDDNYFHEFSDENVPEGTKYIAVQFVSNEPSEDGYSYLIVTYFDLYAVSVEAGEWVELTVNEPSVTMEPLTPETEYEVYVQGICGEGEDDVTNWVGGYFMTPELTTLTQTIALTEGSNWFSTYVDITLENLQNALVEALPGATSITIKAKTQSSRYNGSRWRGALNWDVAQMYILEVPTDCEIALTGMPINPAEHPINIIANGSNWIGFPFSANMSLDDAFPGFAVNGDVVKSKTGNARYTGTRWRASNFNGLEPGKGYIYESNSSEDRTLVYPTSTSKSAQNMSLTTDRKPMKNIATNLNVSLKGSQKASATQNADQTTAKNKKSDKFDEKVKSIYMLKK